MLVCKNQESIVQTGLEELKNRKSSSGFTEEKGRVHHTVRTAYKEFQKLQISLKEEEPAGEYSGAAAEPIEGTCTDMDL